MATPTGRTSICSIVFLDIVEFSKRADSAQFDVKTRLGQIIAEAVAEIPEHERIILDTGDGAAICFLGDPEDALFVATAIMEQVRHETGAARHALRIGINLGPIKIVTDIRGYPNVVGDGINVAQRVMSFAEDGEILVSRSYYEVISRLKEGNERLFRYLGAKTDKHVREHQVYALAEGPGKGLTGNVAEPDVVAEPVPAPVAEAPAGDAVPQSVRDRERVRLANRIGPLADVIVRRAADSATSLQSFYWTIAAAIPDEADRADFLAGATGIHAAEPDPAPPPTGVITDAAFALDDAYLAQIERRLAEHIGPLASVLVRQAKREASDRESFLRWLGARISSDDQRRRFFEDIDSDA